MSKTATHSRPLTLAEPALKPHPRQRRILPVVLALALLSLAVLRLCVGQRFGFPSGYILDVRLMRLAEGLLVGIALATSGVAMQALLRNPLAEPFLLGLSSGAALGVMVQSLLMKPLRATLWPQLSETGQQVARYLMVPHAGALVGALLSMSIVFIAGRRRGVIDPLGLLLTGVVLGTLNGALIMLLNYLVPPEQFSTNLMRWMMGYLNEAIDGPQLTVSALVIVGGFFLLLRQARAMDAASFSDAEALSVGVNLRRLRGILFGVSSILAATAVVLAGPLAFVGLIAPHLARLLVGPAHGLMLVTAAIIGAALVVLADTAVVAGDLGQGLLPIGIFTALLGGPIFLWMLRPHLGRGMD